MSIKKAGFIGPGKVGISMGRYMEAMGTTVTGYVGRSEYDPKQYGIKKTNVYDNKIKLLEDSDILFLSVNDDAIGKLCSEIVKDIEKEYSEKILCHFSGSLSSDILSDFRESGGHVCSIHPIYPFKSKETPIEEMKKITFAIEGDEYAKNEVRALFEGYGNTVVGIDTDKKTLYHTANVMISNLMIAEYEMALDVFEKIGIDREKASYMTKTLVSSNINNLLEKGSMEALTGPIERGDAGTVSSHIKGLLDCEDIVFKYFSKEPNTYLTLYKILSKRLLYVAKEKNPDRDYESCKKILS